jgi:hypothetical protein
VLQPLKAVWYKSWTKLLGWAQAVSGAVLLAVSELNTYVNDSTFKAYLSEIDIPKSVTVSLAVIGIVTWLAHGRDDA